MPFQEPSHPERDWQAQPAPGEPLVQAEDSPRTSPASQPAPVHRIRLRHPWQQWATPLGTRWQRRFNRPSGLGPTQRVWIVVAGIEASGTAALNGQVIGALCGQADRPSAFEVTHLLRPHNQLELELAAPPLAGDSPRSTPGKVWIEIRGQ